MWKDTSSRPHLREIKVEIRKNTIVIFAIAE